MSSSILQQQLPPRLKSACEAVMLAVRTRSPSVLIPALQSLSQGPLNDPTIDLEPFVEYVLIPLFLAVPSDADEVRSKVPERAREETLKCIRIVVDRCALSFTNRADLFFPVILRALAVLTDLDHQGKLAVSLKEETKSEAIQLIDSVIESQISLQNVDDLIVFHCAALLLDASGKDGRSRDVRRLALRALGTLMDRATPAQLEFMFPGATSSLCETARADFKAGPEVPQLACDALRVLIVKVLNDDRMRDRFKEEDDDDGDDEAKSNQKMTLKEVWTKQQQKQQQSPSTTTTTRTPTAGGSKDDQDGDDIRKYLERVFPLLSRLLGEEDAARDVPMQVRIARVKLAAEILERCRLFAISRFSSGNGKEFISVLLRKVVVGCAEAEEENKDCKESFKRVRESFESNDHGLLFISLLEQILLTTLVDLQRLSSQAVDSNAISAIKLGVCAFLFEEIPAQRLRTLMEASQTRILWSLVLFLAPESSRFSHHGKLEFSRITTRETRQRLLRMLTQLSENAPSIAAKFRLTLLDAVETAFVIKKTLVVDASGDDLVDDDGDEIQLPKSCLPQAIFLSNALSASSSSSASLDALLDRLVHLDALWTSPTTAIPNRLSPQDALFNALARTAALEVIASIADVFRAQFKLRLVDSLFPVLQALGEENPGVKLAGENCLRSLAKICGYRDEADLLQSNVDYMVDAIIRRLPQLSANDLRFADVIEALVKRIPVWIPGLEPSPWVQDLVHTILTGLDDRANSPQVVWSLLRIAEVVATRAEDVATRNPPTLQGQSKEDLNVPQATQKSDDVHDRIVDEGIAEITRWLRPSAEAKSASNGDEDDPSAEDEDDPIQSSVDKDKTQILDSVESILLKAAIFIADDDVLVRQQAAKVCTRCISLIGNESPDKARAAVHQIWPFIVEQLKEERNPAIMALLLNALTVAASTKIGADFFSRRFSEEAWPVLEACLDRALPPSAALQTRRRRLPAFRDVELAKKVLKCLSTLRSMLRPKAERIALVTSRFIVAVVNDGEAKELKRLACDVWIAIANESGDVVFLPVAAASNQLSRPLGGRKPLLVLEDAGLATRLWQVLREQ